MNNRRPRRTRKPSRAEYAQKLRNNAAMRWVYEAAVRQREVAELEAFYVAVRLAREREGCT